MLPFTETLLYLPHGFSWSMPQPSEMSKSTIGNFIIKTGKSLEEWAKLIERSGRKDRDELVVWLQTKYKVSSTHAKGIVKATLEDLLKYHGNGSLEELFGKDKAYQKPIYDLLMMHIRRWGPHQINVNKT